MDSTRQESNVLMLSLRFVFQYFLMHGFNASGNPCTNVKFANPMHGFNTSGNPCTNVRFALYVSILFNVSIQHVRKSVYIISVNLLIYVSID